MENTEKTRMAWRNVDQLSSTTDLPEIYINNIYSYLLDKLVSFIADSIGSFVSINSIVGFLKSSKYKTNHETIAT